MTKKRLPPQNSPSYPSVTPEQGITFLRNLIESAEKISNEKLISENQFLAWTVVAKNQMGKAFGENSPNIAEVTNDSGLMILTGDEDDYFWDQYYRSRFERRIQILRGLIEVLQTEVQLSAGQAPKADYKMGEKVFIVHGHNLNLIDSVVRHLEKFQLDHVVLQDKPNQGRTIIEKFEDECKGVGFAVVLMTGDDIGGVKGAAYQELKLRARQNVILELGFFLGRLSRNRVVVLYEDGVDIPSDYSGVLFVKVDEAGTWRMLLAKEIKAAGFEIDMNKMF